MAGLEDLAAFLVANQGVRQQIAQESPYAAPSQQFEGLAGQALGARDYSTRDRVAGAAISGLLSGIFGGMDQSYQNRALEAYEDSIIGKAPKRPEVLSPGLFNQAQTQGKLFRVQQGLRLADQLQQRELDKEKAILNAVSQSPYAAKRVIAAINELEGGAGPIADGGGETSGGESPIAQEAETPSSFESLLEKYAGDKELARDEFKRQRDEPKAKEKEAFERELEQTKQVRGIENDYRKELLGRIERTGINEIASRIQVLQSGINDPSAISDLDFVYGIAKMLDPNSVVRETEAGMIVESGSIPSAIKGQLNKFLSGKSAQNPELRRDMYRLALRNYEPRYKQAEALKETYSRLAKSRGGSPEFVIEGFDFPSLDSLKLPDGPGGRPLTREEFMAFRSKQ